MGLYFAWLMYFKTLYTYARNCENFNKFVRLKLWKTPIYLQLNFIRHISTLCIWKETCLIHAQHSLLYYGIYVAYMLQPNLQQMDWTLSNQFPKCIFLPKKHENVYKISKEFLTFLFYCLTITQFHHNCDLYKLDSKVKFQPTYNNRKSYVPSSVPTTGEALSFAFGTHKHTRDTCVPYKTIYVITHYWQKC